jgi:adenylate cyclase
MTGGTTRVQRRFAAILAADVVGFSALMSRDEEGTHAQIKALQREVINPGVEQHEGWLVKTTGDGFLIEFASPVEAVRCALAIQKALASGPLQLRIGINLGDVIIEPEGDIYGDGVNVAARLEALCDPGGVLISGKVHDEVEGKVEAAFENRGEQTVKNITKPVRVYALRGSQEPSELVPHKPLPLPDKPSIAVLPFTNMSGDPEQEYFVDGVVEDIITALSRVRWFLVIARNSSFTYKGRAVDIRQVGRELGVRYVLEGSIRRAGNRIRITGQLIEAATGRHVWADKFDGDLADIFDLQDELTESIVGAIEPSLQRAEIERAQQKATGDLDAYDLYLRALPHLYTYSLHGFREAEALLKSAVARDPNYSEALAMLADCVGRLTLNGTIDVKVGYALACEYAGRAIAADPENGIVLAMGAYAFAIFGGNFDQALALANRALRVHPNSAHVRSAAAWAYIYGGESHKGIEQLQVAQRLNPIDPRGSLVRSALATAHFFAREFETTVSLMRQVLAEVPSNNIARRYLAAALSHLGRVEEAREVVEDLLRTQPNSSLSLSRTNRFRHPWMMDLYIEGLRKAGLPE